MNFKKFDFMEFMQKGSLKDQKVYNLKNVVYSKELVKGRSTSNILFLYKKIIEMNFKKFDFMEDTSLQLI